MKEIYTRDIGCLYDRIDAVKEMPESDVCNLFNTDSKEDYIAALYEEITCMESDNSYPDLDDDGMDYSALLNSQGLGYASFVKC